MAKAQSKRASRIKRDPLGEKEIPAEASYGEQTARARENFKISRLRIHPLFYLSYAEIKRSAAEARISTTTALVSPRPSGMRT